MDPAVPLHKQTDDDFKGPAAHRPLPDVERGPAQRNVHFDAGTQAR